MKQGTKFILPVRFGLDLNEVTSIKFKFVQDGDAVLTFDYPTTRAVRVPGENIVNLMWEKVETFKFRPGSPLEMDTYVVQRDGYNPDTMIVPLTMSPTLFTALEVGGA